MPGMSIGYYCKGSQEMRKRAVVSSVSIARLSKLVRQCCQTQHFVLFFFSIFSKSKIVTIHFALKYIYF